MGISYEGIFQIFNTLILFGIIVLLFGLMSLTIYLLFIKPKKERHYKDAIHKLEKRVKELEDKNHHK